MSKEQTPVTGSEINSRIERFQARRRLFRVLGSMALVGAVAWQSAGALESIRYNKHTTVERIVNNPIDSLLGNNETHERFKDSSWLVVPGFNMSWHNSRETAATLYPSVSATGEMAWAGFSDKELSIDNLLDETLQYVRDNDVKELNLYGCSFGGMLSIELATRLQDYDIEVPVIVLDSSPATNDNVIDQTGLFLASSPFMGPITYSVRKSYDQHGFDLASIITDTYTDLSAQNDERRLSSTTVGDQANYIRNRGINELSQKLSPDTKLIYIGSDNDQTINTRQAYEDYQTMFPDRIIPHYDSSPVGHASPVGDPEVYGPIMESIARSMLPPEVTGRLLPNMPR